MGWTDKMADAIENDLNSGLRGYHQNMSLSKEQLKQEIVETRLAIIKEYQLKGILPVQDLLYSLNCIPVDCQDINKCPCNKNTCGSNPIAHFEIPQIVFDFDLNQAVFYIGSQDKQHPYRVYNKPLNRSLQLKKFRKRGINRPWVYIDVTPNSRGLLDCYIFEAPLVKSVSVVAIFKDMRQLEDFQCSCDGEDNESDNNLNFLDTAIKERILKQKFFYYRQAAKPLEPNDQTYNAG